MHSLISKAGGIVLIYVMSDIHGEYQKYMQMLEQIAFTKEDTLYVLGDVVDRGEYGLKILRDMMLRSNVIPILGNHEFMAANCLTWLKREITEENLPTIDHDRLQGLSEWMDVGGMTTIREFKTMTKEEQDDVLAYLLEFSLYEEVSVNEKRYILVHGGLGNFDPAKELSTYTLDEFIWERPDYTKAYFSDLYTYVISGHTPTLYITGKATIVHAHQHIVIDCGAHLPTGRLACLCLDTMKEFYV